MQTKGNYYNIKIKNAKENKRMKKVMKIIFIIAAVLVILLFAIYINHQIYLKRNPSCFSLLDKWLKLMGTR